MNEKSRERIKLAILANGGPEHRKEWCRCEPEVNFYCEYCAIFYGLNEAEILLEKVENGTGRI